jgi:hypothetical protein
MKAKPETCAGHIKLLSPLANTGELLSDHSLFADKFRASSSVSDFKSYLFFQVSDILYITANLVLIFCMH